jgi:Fic family protein
VIFHEPEVDEAEAKVHAEIDELRQKLMFATASRRWTGLLSRVSRARAIQGSNSIEGYNVTVDDALAAVDGEAPLDATGETWAAIVGYRNAMTYVLQLSDDKHFRYSADLIRSLHYTMTNYDLSKHPGRWRPGAIFVKNEATGERVYEGPDVELVPPLIDELVTSLNQQSDCPCMVKGSLAHLNLVMIHPFSDGNGRMARCLQSLVLARQGILYPEFLSIEEYLGRHQFAYYDVLATVGHGAWHPERDARPWVRFCLTAHYRQALTVLRRSSEVSRLCDEVDTLIQTLKLPTRTFFAIADAGLGFRVVNSMYRSNAEVSQNLASRDLAELCRVGLLLPHGERRGRHYTAGPKLKEIRARTREPRMPLPDPFASVKALPGQLALPV